MIGFWITFWVLAFKIFMKPGGNIKCLLLVAFFHDWPLRVLASFFSAFILELKLTFLWSRWVAA